MAISLFKPLLIVTPLLLLNACSSDASDENLTEREKDIKLVMKNIAPGEQADFLFLVNGIYDIIEAPIPTEAEIKTLTNRAVKNMVRIEGGEFIMGVNSERLGGDWTGWKPVDGRRQPVSIGRDAMFEHPVRLSTYYLNKYETTNAEFDAFKKVTGREIRFGTIEDFYMGTSTKMFKNLRTPDKPASAHWFEAKDYCEWLGEQTGLPVDLPSEAQWEYAARERGQWLMFPTGWGGVGSLTNRASNETSDVDSLSHSFNDLGIYFMAGNLSEWVLDWYDPTYYQHSPIDNPVNLKGNALDGMSPAQTDPKVHRGGHQYLDNSGGDQRNVFKRFSRTPGVYSMGSVGFRCAINNEQNL